MAAPISVAPIPKVLSPDTNMFITDGPFLETKEHLGGFFLIDVPDLDTALDWAARMPHAASGTAEVRAVRTGMAWQAVLG